MKVLLSIHPEFAEQILNGSKRFEYRKSIFKNGDVKTIVIYATQPVGKVIGEFNIGGIIKKSPDDLWEMTETFSGISKGFFM
jgi:predicted transcriptional regulator